MAPRTANVRRTPGIERIATTSGSEPIAVPGEAPDAYTWSEPMSTPHTVLSLLPELTLEEKALCLGSDFWHTAPVPRLGIPAITLSDGPHGLRRQPGKGDHVGVSGSLPATCFPTACALGSSFDLELARRVGEALGEEARAQDVQVVLGPGINISAPRCAGATSSTSRRTRSSPASSAPRWSKACRARASARR
jgi:beta-glucosidase-like glycosyl hydrolase